MKLIKLLNLQNIERHIKSLLRVRFTVYCMLPFLEVTEYGLGAFAEQSG